MAFFGPPDVDKLAARGKVDSLIKATTYEDPKVREGAARALGEIGDSQATEALVVATTDEVLAVRNEAMGALGRGEGIAAQAVATCLLPDDA